MSHFTLSSSSSNSYRVLPLAIDSSFVFLFLFLLGNDFCQTQNLLGRPDCGTPDFCLKSRLSGGVLDHNLPHRSTARWPIV